MKFTGGCRNFRKEAETDVAQTTSNWASLVDSSQSHGDESDTRTLFKGNVSWFFSPRNQLYATISEGYRRGGTNGTPTTGNFAEDPARSEEHTSELQSLMRISYAVFCLKNKKHKQSKHPT